ncbi:1c0ca190-55c3-4460-b7b5-15fd257bf3aa [Sclerotinia trifoliorum]|uniref:1c0ca190-55c3-4460-b7b5-15fd257bf3aa n=1 Tax=Sclerotinia trifoliorum TaxID=28548 RepID=A0A8H2ZN69_9HELO|nr:1c0ca190-55c3-4460-b7b5-15fd257bf3aa [Sclerotinia trifoliorum]
MLLYTRKAPPKVPKKRSRAGCIYCKEKKKKCNEVRPRCDRCTDRGLQCEYEAVKPRKRRRASSAESALSHEFGSPGSDREQWPRQYSQGLNIITNKDVENIQDKWEEKTKYPLSAISEQSSFTWGSFYENDDEVEEIPREDLYVNSPPAGTLVRTQSQYPDLAMIAPSPVASPLLAFSSPVFLEFAETRNRRALVDHFCNTLSHLIVFKEDTGNPFRQLILPLSHASSPVMNAMYALSSAHMEYRGVENEEKSLDFHNNALQGLANLIQQNDKANREEILGAIMLLVYYEVLVQRGNSSIVHGHLKGAMTIMSSRHEEPTPTSIFLERAFRFYDVITALSLGTPPNSTTQPTTSPFSFPSVPDDENKDSQLNLVDTLLGLSTELWPIIHRLSHLLSYKSSLQSAIEDGLLSKASVLRTELESTSKAIEMALTNWKPSFVAKGPSSPKENEAEEDTSSKYDIDLQEARMQTILNNAEAYRHSAFVYLYRTIHSHPRSHALVQKHTKLSLIACANVVGLAEMCNDGPMSALLWPLFVAACEAETESDRELATKAFGKTERRQGMRNIMRAWEVVQEVWRRADDGTYEDGDWRGICESRGWNIVLG